MNSILLSSSKNIVVNSQNNKAPVFCCHYLRTLCILLKKMTFVTLFLNDIVKVTFVFSQKCNLLCLLPEERRLSNSNKLDDF